MVTNNAANLPELTTDGQLLIGNSAGGPSAATLTAGSNVTITNGAGSITVAASGGGGKILQQVRTTYSSLLSSTAAIPFDDTIPQNTEGTEVMTLSITPTSATSILVVEAILAGKSYLVSTAALFRDSTANAKAAFKMMSNDGGNDMVGTVLIKFWETSGSTSATTYKIRFGNTGTSGTIINSDLSGARIFGGVCGTNMTITEYSS